MVGGMTFEERRAAVAAACEALAGIDGELWAAGGEQLGEFAQLLDELRVRAESGQVDVLAEAVERGEAGAGRAGASAWLLDRSPSLRAGGSARVVRVAEAAADDRYAVVTAAVRGGRVPLVTAQVVVEELERLAPRLAEGAEPAVLAGLVEVASWGKAKDVRGIRARMVARYGAPGEFQADADRVRELRSLSQPSAVWGAGGAGGAGGGAGAGAGVGGLFEYTMVVDAEAMVAIEAAVQGLSAPRPTDGEPDRRPSGQRRMDALLEVLRRGVASADGVPSTAKAELFVTIAMEDLVGRDVVATTVETATDGDEDEKAAPGAGVVVGSGAAGTLLAPGDARRIACDAGIIPVVLGTDGQVLDLGRRFRWFTSAQARALWLRDEHCTYPDCTVPATWTDAHHLWHWADGGPTDLSNAALLCGRHHTLVHRHGYHGQLTHCDDGRPQVTWDLTLGAYDHWLEEQRAQAADRLVSIPVAVAPALSHRAGQSDRR